VVILLQKVGSVNRLRRRCNRCDILPADQAHMCALHISTGIFVLCLAHYVVEYDIVHFSEILGGQERQLRPALALVKRAVDFGYRHGGHHGAGRIPRNAC